jgi:hypothetical protein
VKNASVHSLRDAPVVVNLEDLSLEDEDVKTERERILGNDFDPFSPLVVKRFHKVYKRSGLSPKVAVKDITIGIDEGTIFGL